jgi:hypothetical protein
MATSLVPLVGAAFDGLTKIIGEFHMSPEEKAAAQQAIVNAQQQAQQAANDYQTQLNSIAGQNIRAEEQSGDKFTVRARPAVIWIGLIAILWDYCVVPTASMWSQKPLPSVLLPDMFWWTWGTVVTGYVFSRGMEKVAALPGDSQIKLPLGLGSVGNKS